jgi:hypothetical protein
MEARVPVDAALPAIGTRRPRRSMTALVVAPILVLVIGTAPQALRESMSEAG